MRVVVGGGRYQKDRTFVWRTLDAIHTTTPITRLAEGGCRGTDVLAKDWAVARGIDRETYPADWDRWGKSAGPRRNSDMLREERPDAVIAFPGGTGTRDLVQKAKAASVEIIEVGPPRYRV